jgi:hypothetical protein
LKLSISSIQEGSGLMQSVFSVALRLVLCSALSQIFQLVVGCAPQNQSQVQSGGSSAQSVQAKLAASSQAADILGRMFPAVDFSDAKLKPESVRYLERRMPSLLDPSATLAGFKTICGEFLKLNGLGGRTEVCNQTAQDDFNWLMSQTEVTEPRSPESQFALSGGNASSDISGSRAGDAEVANLAIAGGVVLVGAVFLVKYAEGQAEKFRRRLDQKQRQRDCNMAKSIGDTRALNAAGCAGAAAKP